MCCKSSITGSGGDSGAIISTLQHLEEQLSTPRKIAIQRMHCLLGLACTESSSSSFTSNQQTNCTEIIDGGLPTLLVSLLQNSFDAWTIYYNNLMSSHAPMSSSNESSSKVRICNSTEIKTLQRTMKLLSNTSQLDATIGEEIKRAGTQLICSRLIEQINKCTMKFEGELSDEDDDTLVELQDNVYEIYSPSSTSKCMPFTNEELCNRLPLVYRLRPVSHASEQDERQLVDDNDTIATTIFINQVTKRQSAQSDVGYVMWPSAIVLSRWLISNPHIIWEEGRSKSVLELGAGCGLVGCSAALLISQMNSEHQKEEQQNDRVDEKAVIITDVNDLVIENIVQNINLNDVSSIASVAKLDFYNQTGDNHTGKWIAGEICNSSTIITCTDREGEREPVDVILAADIICQPSDAVYSSKTIYDALKPGGVAYVVCANAEHRFGVDIFASECEKRDLAVISRDVTEMYDGELLSEDMNTAAGYIDGMMLTFFEITKKDI